MGNHYKGDIFEVRASNGLKFYETLLLIFKYTKFDALYESSLKKALNKCQCDHPGLLSNLYPQPPEEEGVPNLPSVDRAIDILAQDNSVIMYDNGNILLNKVKVTKKCSRIKIAEKWDKEIRELTRSLDAIMCQ